MYGELKHLSWVIKTTFRHFSFFPFGETHVNRITALRSVFIVFTTLLSEDRCPTIPLEQGSSVLDADPHFPGRSPGKPPDITFGLPYRVRVFIYDSTRPIFFSCCGVNQG